MTPPREPTTRKPPAQPEPEHEPVVEAEGEPDAMPDNVILLIDYLEGRRQPHRKQTRHQFEGVWLILTLLLAFVVGYVLGEGMRAMGHRISGRTEAAIA